jgi:L-threonylcarbamoyladenylate synthase
MTRLPILAQSPEAAIVRRAVHALQSGRVVAYPTDTLYGLAVDPRDDAAVARLFAAKGRGPQLAIPLIAASIEQAQEAADLTASELALARRFWPGPLTIVTTPKRTIAKAVLGGGSSVAIRVPSHAVACAIADAFGFCITATSANRSGEAAASSAGEISAALAAHLDLVLDAGPVTGGLPSTIVEIGAGGPRLVRAGAVPWERVLESLE